ncbi:NAD-dependent epimerase/dehydratase family protein [Tropicimonas sp. IMCC6043]|uniref:NAD-dependent epimerase/dehydratase family protein n=1 Tax=Tropicimonas sp. IMCC6043 TaxID=2510645 RepID=UPI0013ED8C8A|nr:NAD-dependent epimerase/dehydratase family protein [Tropicimonas sp. IMCC6043]
MSVPYRILILGAGGFVGGYLRHALEARFAGDAEVVATSHAGNAAGGTRSLDLTDEAALDAALADIRPTHVINLAGIASPVSASKALAQAWLLHATAPEALGRLVLRANPETWLFHVSSGLVYGRSALSGKALTEEMVLAPMDPYAVTKAAGDLAIGALAGEGLKCLRLRPFNHIGPGQSEDFVVPAFAAQLARIASGKQDPVLRVGNLEAERDLLDVRDVAEAYATLVEQSDALVPGEIFNISSDKATLIRSVLDALIDISGLDVKVELDPARQRPSDLPSIRGSSEKLSSITGWFPRYSIWDSLRDVYLELSS